MAEGNPNRDSKIVALLTDVQLPLQVYVRSLLPGDTQAGDVAQQANSKIWEKRDEFELGTNFKAWAFAIARFEVLSYRKRAARDARLAFSDDLDETLAAEFVGMQDDLNDRHAALQECLAGLQAKDRELLLNRYVESETLSAYADRIGRSLGGLKVSLHRLRNTLLSCVRRKLAEVEAGA